MQEKRWQALSQSLCPALKRIECKWQCDVATGALLAALPTFTLQCVGIPAVACCAAARVGSAGWG